MSVYFKSKQRVDLVFKMFASFIFVFIFTLLTFSNIAAENSKSTDDPDCGKLTSQNLDRALRSTDEDVVPWQANIYSKLYKPYMQICGGSIITPSIIISAAHCFWEGESVLPPDNYMVAVSKKYRPYNNPQDLGKQQQSDVDSIKIPSRFQGPAAFYQDDIALVMVKTPFVYNVFIRPVCLNFDSNLEKNQLTDGNLGKVAGWSIGGKNGEPSNVMKVVDLPYIKIEECIANSPPAFREFITYDKFCAGSDGTSLCKGDGGVGLAFQDSTTQKYYLRGVASSSPINENACGVFTTFTSISKYEDFIKENL